MRDEATADRPADSPGRGGLRAGGAALSGLRLQRQRALAGQQSGAARLPAIRAETDVRRRPCSSPAEVVYPSSTLLERYDEIVGELEAAPHAAPASPPTAAPRRRLRLLRRLRPRPSPPGRCGGPTEGRAAPARLAPTENGGDQGHYPDAAADGLRVSIEMNGEIAFRQERLDNPKRVFFDLKGVP